MLRAQAAALAGLPRMLAKRREIARRERIPTSEVVRLLRQHSISARHLPLG